MTSQYGRGAGLGVSTVVIFSSIAVIAAAGVEGPDGKDILKRVVLPTFMRYCKMFKFNFSKAESRSRPLRVLI